MAEIRFTAVHHRFGQRVVLNGIDLTLAEHRIGIVGANGSGKSTLARMINGLVTPTSGTVTLDGLDTTAKGREVRRRVGFVFTDPDNQIVMPTVAEDVAFSLRRSSRVVGSSATTTAGPVINTAASASSCFCPPESRWVGWSACPDRPNRANDVATRPAISCLLRPDRRSEKATSSATVGITI